MGITCASSIEEQMKSWRGLAIVLVVLLVGTGVLTWKITATLTWKTAYAAGESNGKGQLNVVQPGVAYRVELVGVPVSGSEEYVRMEGVARGSYGMSGEVKFSLPQDAKRGDQFVFTDLAGFSRVLR